VQQTKNCLNYRHFNKPFLCKIQSLKTKRCDRDSQKWKPRPSLQNPSLLMKQGFGFTQEAFITGIDGVIPDRTILGLLSGSGCGLNQRGLLYLQVINCFHILFCYQTTCYSS